ncbi:hypothetical protein ScPMuIL_011297 [Solemya velum]
MPKKIAVIGAGASGLTAVKCCLEQDMEPVCYERSGHIGGLWYFNDECLKGQASVSRSTIINSSKEMMSYSDFPAPKEYPIFMHNTHVLNYFHLYAEYFGVKNYIHFNTEVLMVSKADTFEQTGQWKVDVRNRKTGITETNVFDGVLVCSGHHADKNLPSFHGMKSFRGRTLHSQDYKGTTGYEDKRVLVIGLGNSGGDAAVELSRVASRVFLSTRSGAWVFSRVSESGKPSDMLFSSRFFTKLQNTLPMSFVTWALRRQLNQKMDHDMYAIRPNFQPGQQHPLCNDDLPNRLASGSVKLKTDVKRITENGVEFVDGTFEDDIDVIVLATGYIFGFPFIDKSVFEVENNKLNLFKYMFLPEIEMQTMAVIGCVQPIGSTIPIAEMQSRLACRVIKGEVTLPSREQMLADIRKKEVIMSHRYVKSQRHTIQVDYGPFMDEIAELNGCKPDTKALLFSDFKLWSSVVFGPCTPYQYRLMGPNKWDGARDAILSQWDRTVYPLGTRPLPITEEAPRSKAWLYVIYLAIIGYLFRCYLFG